MSGFNPRSLRGSPRGSFRGRERGTSFNRAPRFEQSGNVVELGSFLQDCEGDLVCESTNPKVPYFNAPIMLENSSTIGKIDEILGPINKVYFTIKPSEGIVAASFKAGDKVFIDSMKLLPLERFLQSSKPKNSASSRGKGRGDRSSRGRGQRGRGAGFSRGASRGAIRGFNRGVSRGAGNSRFHPYTQRGSFRGGRGRGR